MPEESLRLKDLAEYSPLVVDTGVFIGYLDGEGGAPDFLEKGYERIKHRINVEY